MTVMIYSLYDSNEQMNNQMGSASMIDSPDDYSPCSIMSPSTNAVMMPTSSANDHSGVDGVNSGKKSTTRRNAWGNMSYADLITQAIMSSPEKRLTLSQGR